MIFAMDVWAQESLYVTDLVSLASLKFENFWDDQHPGTNSCDQATSQSCKLLCLVTPSFLGDNSGMKLQVQCYSGSKAGERPVRFRLDNREYLVEEVLDQWYGPEHIFFKLRADDGNFYILRHCTSLPDGEWELVSFRETRPA
ncbi:MAG TPA: hypothetical protein VJQ54_22115 [Candidatus Sulfotelmatobacter sp.]|nr:hypothetical protein [Candidatus Sulfotelmatobacter sp.]